MASSSSSSRFKKLTITEPGERKKKITDINVISPLIVGKSETNKDKQIARDIINLDEDKAQISADKKLDQKNKGSIVQDEVYDDSYDDLSYESSSSDDQVDHDPIIETMQAYFDTVDIPTGVEAPFPWYVGTETNVASGSGIKSTSNLTPSFAYYGAAPTFLEDTDDAGDEILDPVLAPSSSISCDRDIDDAILEEMTLVPLPEDTLITPRRATRLRKKFSKFKFNKFNKFDTITTDDQSDHHYASRDSPQVSKKCARRILAEWRILEKDLPDGIFVKIYSSRIDILRAVIIGTEGTPYQGSLFFFDILFPPGYPNEPPKVYYHSGGLRINPLFHDSGEVCLSLLGHCSSENLNENWIPGISTILQVLVSIQALVLNENPYYNEPSFEHLIGTPAGEISSNAYNEKTFILSLWTMIYIMRQPPKHFVKFVFSYFYHRAHEIMTLYMGHDSADSKFVDSSVVFKKLAVDHLGLLVVEFQKSGVNCDRYLTIIETSKVAYQRMISVREDYDEPLPVEDSSRVVHNVNDLLIKFQQFMQFDTVEDHEGHYYASTPVTKLTKSCTNRIQEEWKMLQNGLPDTIFVRVYESRIDLLRAVIVGAEGTPYHDGLFLFDIFFPSDYPNKEPLVHYHSGGVKLNPNLYEDGTVCVSLLGTSYGDENEKWRPGASTVLQVLVSIQALILSQNPYFNETGRHIGRHIGTRRGGYDDSQKYNKYTFVSSLKNMIYIMRQPPKHFEDLVLGHFYSRAHDILTACIRYMKGAPVGSLVKSELNDSETSSRSCPPSFAVYMPEYLILLVAQFEKIGVQDCKRYLNQLAGTSYYYSPCYSAELFDYVSQLNQQFN